MTRTQPPSVLHSVQVAVLWVLCEINHLIHRKHKSHDVDLVICILQIRQLRPRDVNEFTQSHTACK